MNKALERLAHLELNKIAFTSFSNLWFSWQYMGVFYLFASIAYYQPFLNDWPIWIKENCVQHFFFRTYVSLGNTWQFFLSFRLYCLLSALLCGSSMCTQVSSPVSKLEITRLLQPLYVFKSSRAHLRRCVFCSSVSKWGTHLAQTFLRSKRFQNCLQTAFLYASTTSYIFDRQSHILFDHNLYSSDVSYGNRGFRPSRTGIIFKRKFPSFKSFNPPKNCVHWNGLRFIYTTQFIKYLLWIYIKPNAAFNIATNFSTSGPCSNVTSKLVSVYDCIYFNLK